MGTNSKRAITIKDIAAQAGVSSSTVSRVLSAPGMVNENTRERVYKIMEALSFTPKPVMVAKSLSRICRIGVLLPFFVRDSFVERVRGITDTMPASDYEIILYTVTSQRQLDEYLATLSTENWIDGLIVIGLNIPESARLRLKRAGLDVVLIQQTYPGFSGVSIDNVRGGRLAAEYLLNRGYRKFGFIGAFSSQPFTVSATEDRLRGFRERLLEENERGATTILDEAHVQVTELSLESTDIGIRPVFFSDDRPEAVFAASDTIAVRVMKEALDRGLQVPNDLAVLGFDNLEIADLMNLTTVSQHLHHSGKIAAEMLMKGLQERVSIHNNVVIDLEVVERRSC